MYTVILCSVTPAGFTDMLSVQAKYAGISTLIGYKENEPDKGCQLSLIHEKQNQTMQTKTEHDHDDALDFHSFLSTWNIRTCGLD